MQSSKFVRTHFLTFSPISISRTIARDNLYDAVLDSASLQSEKDFNCLIDPDTSE
jgi:hypothetical protein